MKRWWMNTGSATKGDIIYFINEYTDDIFDAVWLSLEGGLHLYLHAEMTNHKRGSSYDPFDIDYQNVVRGVFEGKMHR